VTSIDVTEWEPADEEPLGTKPKQWLRDGGGVLWLWKQSTLQNDARHGPYRKGDDWSEVVAGRVGKRLGMSVAEVELATRGDQFGVISRSVLIGDGESLVHGNEMLSEIGVGGRDPHDRTGYTIEAVARALEGVEPPIGSPGELIAAFDWFAGYLILDALIGNTDRHQDNWATIRGPGPRRLAPSFDHASCLGFLLSDQERQERLEGSTNRTVAAFAAGARTKFEGSPAPIDAVRAAVRIAGGDAKDHWLGAVDAVPDLADCLTDIPDDRMSATAKAFASGLYTVNHSVVSQRLRTIEI
jgi:hypothetical protein